MIISDKNIKFKIMEYDELLLALDRLTRFKSPNDKYFRVFKDILVKHLIEPKIGARQFDELPVELVSKYVGIIWNKSVLPFSNPETNNKFRNLLKRLDELVFRVIDSDTKKLMKTKLSIYPIVAKCLDSQQLPKNLKFISKLFSEKINFDNNTILSLRQKNSLRFPISKLILVEGITEEILLPVFAKNSGYDFDRHGVFVLGAGGKSKMPYLYQKFKDCLKIPVLILLDSDASEIFELMKTNILSKDEIILLNSGEFEDIVSKNLIKRSFNSYFYDIDGVKISELRRNDSMCKNIEYVYKTRGLGEFQKAHFAKILAQNVKYKTDISPEVASIVEKIRLI